METSINTAPYTMLAEVYDEVMANVDYQAWADFIDDIIQIHHPHPDKILEMACGTGSLTFEMERRGYRITGGDSSSKMIKRAKTKADKIDSDVVFHQLDFLNIPLNKSFDIIISIFDSVNYLLDEKSLLKMFAEVKRIMKNNALFIFDFTTPKNSLESLNFLNDQKGTVKNGYHYFRKSWYDDEQQIHYNSFDIEKYAPDGETVLEHFTELHCQRAYALHEMERIIAKTDFSIITKYGEFDMQAADETSFRITMVIQ